MAINLGRKNELPLSRRVWLGVLGVALAVALAACGTTGPVAPPDGPSAGVLGPDEANVVVLTSPTDAVIAFGNTAVVGLGSDSAVASTPVPARVHYFLAPEGRYTANVRSSGHPARDVVIDVPADGVVGVMVRLDDAAAVPLQMAVSAGADRSVALNQNVDLDGHVETGGADTPFAISWSVDKGPGIVTFADPSVPHTAISFEKPGTYQLRLTADIDGLVLSNPVTLSVEPFGGTIYYVDVTGSDGNAGTSKAAPLATLGRAGELVRAGDIVRIRAGVYYQYNDMNGSLGLPATTFTTDGTKNEPIVIESEPGEHAIFDGTNWPNGKPIDVDNLGSTPQRPALLYLPVRHYIVRNLEFRHSAGAAVWTDGSDRPNGGSYNAFVNLELHHNHGNGLTTRGLDNLTEGNLAEFIAAHNNASTRNGGNSADGIKMSNTTNSTIRYVQLYKNSDDGVDFYGSTDMTIEHSSAWLNGYYFPDDDNDPYSTRGRKDAPTGDGNGFKMGGMPSGPDANNVTAFNLAWANKRYGLTYNSAGSIKFFNNTSYANELGGFKARCFHSTLLRNNLSLEDTNLITDEGGRCPDGSMPDSQNNSWDLNIKPRVLSTDPTSPNFLQPKATGGAIDKGQDIGMPYTGTAPDLGAHELGLAQAAPGATGVTFASR